MSRLDLVLVLDARFEGGVSTAVATEIEELTRAPALCIGLLLVKAHLLGLPYPVHPMIRSFISQGQVRVLRPEEDWHCPLAVIHHPVVFANMPRARLPLRAERAVLVLHHPLRDAAGQRQYDLTAIVQNIHASLSDDVQIAPVSQTVRRSLGHAHVPGAVVMEHDWTNLLTLDAWPFDPDKPVPAVSALVIGRHARPEALKWPDTRAEAEAAYLADAPGVEVRILGSGPFLDDIYGTPLPANWVLEDFAYDGVPAFLAGLDAYVYFHSSTWSEAFGRNIVEAMACGLVTVLPPIFAAQFGEAAVYCSPAKVEQTLQDLLAHPDAWQAQRHRARLWAETHCDKRLARDRLARLGVPGSTNAAPEALCEPVPTVGASPARPVVLFLSTNGIGVGHLTQQMAIADRLPEGFRPVFASMCLSLHVAAAQGHPVFYLPHHKHLNAGPEVWNKVLAEEIFDLIRHLRPVMLAYDGTAVFEGLTAALAEFPDLMSLWVRRAMWRDCHQPFLEYHHAFTAVIEPGELAGAYDYGPTRAMRPVTNLVPPVLHIEPNQRHARDAARAHYDLSSEQLAVALQLGSGTNFEMRALRQRIIALLLQDPRVIILDIISPLAPMPTGQDHPRLRRFREYPSFRHSRALDAAIGVAGYNAFHEQILGAIPTLFIPNEAPEMDSQLTRAHWAAVHGLGLSLRARHDIGDLDATVAQLLDDKWRTACAARLARLPQEFGAQQVADFITDYSAMIRTDRWPEDSYPR